MSEGVCQKDGDGLCTSLCTSRISIFQSLSMDEQRQLVKAAGHRHVAAGTTLFREDDPADRLLVVHRGRIKLNRYSAEGKEYVLDIVEAGEIYGEQHLFSNQRQDMNAVTLEATSYCEIFKQDITALIMKDPAVGIRMLEELGAKFSRVSRMQEFLSLNDAKGRLAGFLLHLSRDTSSMTIRITRETLSAAINLRTETISRKLNEMAREGLLALEGHKIVRLLDPAGLRAVFDASE
ncbi:MAG: Crp/Fnr family transcriptional regulator [Christensenellales bacterium]